MVRFWDTSAIFPLLAPEMTSREMERQFAMDRGMVVWWVTSVECASAIEHLNRERSLRPDQSLRAYAALDALRSNWREVEPSEAIRESASRFLRVHPLRAADALQLAAAFAAAEDRPATLEFLSLDERLVEAARREGFRIVAVGG